MFINAPSVSLLATLAALSEVTLAAPGNVQKRELSARQDSRPRLGNVAYGSKIVSCSSPGKIALTFDDGPGTLTAGIVDTLEKNNVKGTFFMVGKNGGDGLTTGNYDSLLKRMHASGHHLASHSFSHPNFDEIDYDQKVLELEKNEKAFADILGFIPTYFRPPYTACDEECYQALGDMGYHVTDYDLDTKDWEAGGVNAKARYSSAVKAADPSYSSFISLSHDIQDFTANGFVQFMIDVGKEKGFQFVTLGECLGDPASNWYRDPKTFGPADTSIDPPEPSTTSTSSTATPTSSKAPEPKKPKETTKTESEASSSTSIAKYIPAPTDGRFIEASSIVETSIFVSEDASTTVTMTTTFATTTAISVASSAFTSSASNTTSAEPSTPTETSSDSAPSAVDEDSAAIAVSALPKTFVTSLVGFAAWMLL
ncbi:Chitin deacetylase like protein [Verticillium longisporum]|uniref:Chitin deacetylase like protein n=1 Tax=Verticillium longisporum TaxID=100787 RepID=A0A8I2ZES9_VERLO|nr:Chitin deacetylase like protein [Verticillium longisporum]